VLERECTRDVGADFVLLLDGREEERAERFEVLEERPPEDETERRDLLDGAEAVVGGLATNSPLVPFGEPTNDCGLIPHEEPADP